MHSVERLPGTVKATTLTPSSTENTVATLTRIIGGLDPCCTCLPPVASAFTLQIHSGLGACG